MPTKPSDGPKRLATLAARARTIGEELGAATDALNASLQALEQSILGLNLGVTENVSMGDDGDPVEPFERRLRFGKDERTWGLFIDFGPLRPENTDWSTTPLRNASREVRLAAVDYLPQLVEKLIQRAETDLLAVRQRVDAVRQMSDSLKPEVDDDIPF